MLWLSNAVRPIVDLGRRHRAPEQCAGGLRNLGRESRCSWHLPRSARTSVDEKRLTKGLRADGIGTVISGIFNRLIVQICLEALVARACYSIAPMLA